MEQIRQRRSLISAQGWSVSDNLGLEDEIVLTLKGLPGVKPFQGLTILFVMHPGFSLRSNPGLKLANTFGVKEPTPLVLISQHFRC